MRLRPWVKKSVVVIFLAAVIAFAVSATFALRIHTERITQLEQRQTPVIVVTATPAPTASPSATLAPTRLKSVQPTATVR